MSAGAQGNELQQVSDFGTNPGNLGMYVYAPIEHSRKELPLVVVLHGCTQSAESVAAHTGWNKLADSLGFHVLYPQTGFKNNVSGCFRWFSEKDISTDQGESASIFQMINKMLRDYKIDSSRVYITGMSAGGAMAVAMMVRYPELFAAGAIVAGGPYGAAWSVRSARKAMRGKVKYSPQKWAETARSQRPDFRGRYPVISVYHGSKDKTVHPDNADHLIDQWTALHQTGQKPSKVERGFQNHSWVERCEYTDQQNRVIAVQYQLQGIKHALSIATGNSARQGGKDGKFMTDTGFHIPWQCVVDFGLTDSR